jgi:hypothetical protein
MFVGFIDSICHKFQMRRLWVLSNKMAKDDRTTLMEARVERKESKIQNQWDFGTKI